MGGQFRAMSRKAFFGANFSFFSDAYRFSVYPERVCRIVGVWGAIEFTILRDKIFSGSPLTFRRFAPLLHRVSGIAGSRMEGCRSGMEGADPGAQSQQVARLATLCCLLKGVINGARWSAG